MARASRMPGATVRLPAFVSGLAGCSVASVTTRVRALGGLWSEPGTTLEIDGFHWRVMADPEGNEFCIMTAPKG